VTLNEFINKFHMAPVDLHRMAEGMVIVDNDSEVAHAGKVFLDAEEKLFRVLRERQVEFG